MEIIKTFTEPDSIREALLLIDEAGYSQRPIIEVTYNFYYSDMELMNIKGDLWSVNTSGSCREDDKIVVLDIDNGYNGRDVLLRDIIRLDIYDVGSESWSD